MELDEFLEKDIIHFLEERKEKKASVGVDREEDYGLYLTKDYIKEVTNALEKDEISIAQKLFDELKIHYDSLPKGSLEEKKIYSMLEQIYSKINSYLQLKGNSDSLRSFNDALGQGLQGALSTKIHLTTTKMDKKLDNIDVKLTGFGRDMKDLKSTLSVSDLNTIKQANSKIPDSKINDAMINEEVKRISSDNTLSINTPKIQTNVFQELKMNSDRNSSRRAVSEPSAVFLNTPKIQIIAPSSPKDSRGAPTIDRENRNRENRTLSVPKEIEKKNFEDITVFEEHKPTPPQEVKPAPVINIREQKIVQPDTRPDTQMLRTPQTPHTAKEEPKRRMKLFKIPKKVATKKQEQTIKISPEKIPEEFTEKIPEKIIPEIITKTTNENAIIEKNQVANDDFEIMKVKTENKKAPITVPVKNDPAFLGEENNDLFDSPFQKPVVGKPAENVIFSSIQTPSKASPTDSLSNYLNTSQNTVPSTSSSMSLNSFDGLYSEALKELNLKNYEGASKLFMKVLEMRPAHKASIIRLKQCEEAMHNA